MVIKYDQMGSSQHIYIYIWRDLVVLSGIWEAGMKIFLGYDDQMMKFTMHLDLDGMMLVLTRSQMGACRGPVVVLFDLATILFFGTKSSTLQPGCK